MHDVTVIGSGIIGLTSAIRLQEAGFRVRILARELPPCTTSNKAAAVWEPYKAEPAAKIAGWAAASYSRYVEESVDPSTGISRVELFVVSLHAFEDPFWLRPEYPSRRLRGAELPAGATDGLAVEVPFISSGRYLDHLLRRFAGAGGEITLRTVRSLEEAVEDSRGVVHCCGLGAKELVGDTTLFPIRGQLAVVKVADGRQPLRHIVDDTSFPDPVYVMPRGEECVLGGTAQEHAADLGEDLVTRERILERCLRLEPRLEGCTFLRPVVGLRPGRPEIRLELERLADGTPVVHNYGHGGSGFTVAWGCADEVTAKLQAAL